MNSVFCERPIGRCGEVLREQRLALGRDALEFSRQLRIPLRFLTAFERSEYCTVPTAFTKPWLRSYAEALGLGWETIGGRAIAEWEYKQRSCSIADRHREEVGALARRSTIRIAVVALFAAATLYIGSVVAKTFLPPPLSIPALAVSQASAGPLEVEVKTLPGTTVWVNGKTLRTDEAGVARVAIEFVPGENIVVARAKRLHSRAREVQYRIVAR